MLGFGITLFLNTFSQNTKKASSITITHICRTHIDHYIPVFYLVAQPGLSRYSNVDSICVLTDEKSFIGLLNFIQENNSGRKVDKTTKYEYGSFCISIKNIDTEILSFIIDDNTKSINFFKRMIELIRNENLDVAMINNISSIIPHSRDSGLK